MLESRGQHIELISFDLVCGVGIIQMAIHRGLLILVTAWRYELQTRGPRWCVNFRAMSPPWSGHQPKSPTHPGGNFLSPKGQECVQISKSKVISDGIRQNSTVGFLDFRKRLLYQYRGQKKNTFRSLAPTFVRVPVIWKSGLSFWLIFFLLTYKCSLQTLFFPIYAQTTYTDLLFLY